MASPMARHRVNAETSNAREAERVYRETLDAKTSSLGTARLKAPPPRERVSKRFGGGTRARSSEWDWFYELHPDEQKRIRSNWIDRHGGVAPDEIEHAGTTMHEWLTLTRGVDAARAVQTGRGRSTKRYGGMTARSLVHSGDAEDYGRPVRSFRDRHGVEREHRPNANGVAFYTDKEGRVHPITPKRHGATRTITTATGKRIQWAPVVDTEVF